MEGGFCELRVDGVLRSSSPRKFSNITQMSDAPGADTCYRDGVVRRGGADPPALLRKGGATSSQSGGMGPHLGGAYVGPRIREVQLTKLQSVQSNRSIAIGGEGGFSYG